MASASRPAMRRLVQAAGVPQWRAMSSAAPRASVKPKSRTGLPNARQTRRLNTLDTDEAQSGTYSEADHEHAVISTFDLFSIGIGPSSSHTVGPMRAGNIFVSDLAEAGLLSRVSKIRVAIYGSLALTGEGHMTPSALLSGLESADVETVDTSHVPERFAEIKSTGRLFLGNGLGPGKGKDIKFDYAKDFIWEWGRKLSMHSNGMRLTVYDDEGYVLATNDLFSVGGGFVVNGALSINPDTTSSKPQGNILAEPDPQIEGKHPLDLAENMFYKEIRRSDAAGNRRTGPEVVASHEGENSVALSEESSSAAASVDRGQESSDPQPRYAFHDANSLLALCHKHNLTIAQLVYENEKSNGYTDDEIFRKLFRIWEVMDNSILEGVEAPTDSILPGSLKLHRRAPGLYRRLTRGLYPSHGSGAGTGLEARSAPSSPSPELRETGLRTTGPKSIASLAGKRQPPRVHGTFDHPLTPSPPKRTTFPAMDYLTVYAMAVNETNAAGGRIVTAPTNGAAGIIPAVLKYTIEFVSDDPERDIPTFLLTAAAIGMLYKRGATISAAEGGCMAEVGVACSMAAGAFAACMGASPEAIEQAAEIGIEHNLGLTCDPIGGLVQAPCIERNALGAIKAMSSANLALSSETGTQKVRLDDAIRAMRVTAKGMRNEFKETSLSGLATSVPLNIPVSVPDC